MRRALFALQIAAVLLAAALLLVPLPSVQVERYYADWWYPGVQSALTRWSNTSAFSLFDPLLLLLSLALAVVWSRAVSSSWRLRSLRPVAKAAAVTMVVSSCVYVWFALAWGLNYAREPLESAIGYSQNRVTPAALRALAERAVLEVNGTHAAAHAAGFPGPGETPAALVGALHRIELRLGRRVPTVPGRPKKTLLAAFFRMSGVDGLHAPFLLETLLNPSLTAPERPAVLAHEWAHLSGYAPEDDASFVGLLAAIVADAPSRYSAWLRLFDDTVSQLPREQQREFVGQLAPGPQADREAIRDRLRARVELVADVSWRTYDHYLKSQGVRGGVDSYSRVVQLLLGSGALDWQ